MTEIIPSAPAPALAAVHCPDCGYDLRGNSGRCAECGLSLESLAASESRLPWAAASGLRKIPAYARTALNVLTRPRLVCREIPRELDESAARRFRRVTIGILAASGWAALAAALFLPQPDFLTTPIVTPALTRLDVAGPVLYPIVEFWGGWGVGLALAGLMIGIVWSAFLITGTPVPLFRRPTLDPRVQSRAAALSQYACGALTLFPLLAALGALLLPTRPDGERFILWAAAIAVAGLLALGAYWLVLWSMAARVLRRGGQRWIVVLLTPPLWLFVGLLGVLVPAFLLLFAGVVLDSLTWL